MGKKAVNLFIVIYISLVAILLRGYSYGTGDQAIHLPLIFRLQDSALYPNDYLFLSGQSSYSFFYPIIAYLQSLFNNDARIYFIYYVITLILLFIMITAISNKLFGKGLAWFFSLLLFIFPYYIGGSAILTVETSFVPRVLTHLLSLYILFLLLSKKYLLSFFILGVEFLIHPLSAIWTGVVVLTMTALDKNINRISILIKGLLIVLLLTSLLIFPQIINLFRIETNSPTTEWLSILMERNSYAFPLLWTIKGWLSLLLGLLPISFYLFMRIFINKKIEYKERFMIALLISGIITLVFQIIFTGIFPLSSVISLQLGRIWLLPVVISLICLGFFMEQLSKKLKLNSRFILYSIVLILSALSVSRIFNFMKTQNERWISAQLWANNHTDKQCSFLVPFETQGFRVYSKRPITGDYKDGTLSFYSPIIAQDWNKRRTDLGNWENFNLINLEKLQKEYHFSFMVSHVKTNFNLPIMYKNDEFIIYQMPQREEDCRVI